MATAKKPANKSYASNPGAKSPYKAPAKKAPAKKNPTKAIAKRPAAKRPRPNPSPIVNSALIALGGALTVVAFDEVMNRIPLAISSPIKIGSKAAAGWAVGSYGRRYLGTWASVIQGALWFSAAMDIIDDYVRPQFPGLLTSKAAPQVTGAGVPVQNTATGETGLRYTLTDGNTVDIFSGQSQMANA